MGKRTSPDSPVQTTRNIPKDEKLRLFVAAGGRCEFPGCNTFLLQHRLTTAKGQFAEMAHVVAFQQQGPRGDSAARPGEINAAENLMLLCAPDHKHIDDDSAKYPVELLQRFKREHEERIHWLTGLGPEMRTCVIQLKATIGGQAVDVPANGIIEALKPRYPAALPGILINLADLHREDPSFFDMARHEIHRILEPALRASHDARETQHFSVFALAPIPVLVVLGRELGDKLAVDLFQRHLDQSWTWRQEGPAVEFKVQRVREGTPGGPAALLLSLSGRVTPASLPEEAREWALYEILPSHQEPSRELLRRREDLLNFIGTYRQALHDITTRHEGLRELSLFPAVPAPVAIACGQHVLPKAHPPLRVYDRVDGAFRYAITTNTPGDR